MQWGGDKQGFATEVLEELSIQLPAAEGRGPDKGYSSLDF